MKTHVMIRTPPIIHTMGNPRLKKGDEVTLREVIITPRVHSGVAYEFEEDIEIYYCSSLFAPLERKPEIGMSSEELEEFIRERTEEKAETIKKPRPQLA